MASKSRHLKTIVNIYSNLFWSWRSQNSKCFFWSCTDFELAQLALDAVLTKAHIDKLIQLVMYQRLVIYLIL